MKIISLIALCLLATFTFAKESKPAKSSAAWDKLAEDFLSQIYYSFNPTSATADGLHEYDTKLENYSKADVDHRIARSRVAHLSLSFRSPPLRSVPGPRPAT